VQRFADRELVGCLEKMKEGVKLVQEARRTRCETAAVGNIVVGRVAEGTGVVEWAEGVVVGIVVAVDEGEVGKDIAAVEKDVVAVVVDEGEVGWEEIVVEEGIVIVEDMVGGESMVVVEGIVVVGERRMVVVTEAVASKEVEKMKIA
jgi:hypothetical protein